MKRIHQRIFALTLALLLVISMFACKREDAGAKQSESSGDTLSDSFSQSLSESESATESETKRNKYPVSSSTVADTVVRPRQKTEGILEIPDEGDLSKTLDIYIIAGQSNANGSTKISDKNAAYTFAPELEDGFSHVHYAGNSGTQSNAKNWQPVTLGFGKSTEHMGPEAGMAKALSEYYNEDTGRHAGLIKLARGGTSLLNDKSGSNADGNWVSPSYAKQLGIRFAYPTGGLYNFLLNEVEQRIMEALEYGDYGFTSVRIMGLYWMQGCQDRDYLDKYRVALPLFVSDLRADLSAFMKHMTGTDNDLGASDMPFVIGTISETYDLSSATAQETNRKFIAQQKAFCDPNSELYVGNCYTVDNSQYSVSRYNPDTGKAEKLSHATDKYHWGQADALKIGENAGKKLLEICQLPSGGGT